MLKKIAATALLTIALAGCDSDKKVITVLATQLGAAEDHPCAELLAYQNDLNGAPDEIRSVSSSTQGSKSITEQHWYAALQMIVYFNYAQGEQWCESWTESGVSWE